MPLNIIDTAGLRETDDVVEKIGIERTWAAVARADVVLHLIDATNIGDAVLSADAALLDELLDKTPAGTPCIRVVNKTDLTNDIVPNDDANLYMSAKTGDGLSQLRNRLLEIVGFEKALATYLSLVSATSPPFMPQTSTSRVAYAHALTQDQKLGLFAEELRLAQGAQPHHGRIHI